MGKSVVGSRNMEFIKITQCHNNRTVLHMPRIDPKGAALQVLD